jgi:hypothetical protein
MQQQLSINAAQSGDSTLEGGSQAITLKPFILPLSAPRSAVAELFSSANAGEQPRYASNARVRALKAGAEALAVSSGDAPEVLLARQHFGNGSAAVLVTDLLWRWKLSLPSGSHTVEKFWQQLLLSLAPTSGQGFRVMKLTELPAANMPAVFVANTETAPAFEAVSPGGKRQRLTAANESTTNGQAWQASFTPTMAGRWQLRATDSSGREAHLIFPVGEKPVSAELLNLPADLTGMKQLAESTGGALVRETADFQSRLEPTTAAPPKAPEPLWNSSVLLVLMLAAYVTELIARRFCKLL